MVSNRPDFDCGEESPSRERWLPQLERGGVSFRVCAAFCELDLQPEASLRRALPAAAALAEPPRVPVALLAQLESPP
jgi:hypothetical protein